MTDNKQWKSLMNSSVEWLGKQRRSLSADVYDVLMEMFVTWAGKKQDVLAQAKKLTRNSRVNVLYVLAEIDLLESDFSKVQLEYMSAIVEAVHQMTIE